MSLKSHFATSFSNISYIASFITIHYAFVVTVLATFKKKNLQTITIIYFFTKFSYHLTHL